MWLLFFYKLSIWLLSNLGYIKYFACLYIMPSIYFLSKLYGVRLIVLWFETQPLIPASVLKLRAEARHILPMESHSLLALTLAETMGMSFELNRMRYPATCGRPMSPPAVLCKLHKRTNLLSSTRGHLLMDTSSQGSRGSNHSPTAAYLALLVLSVLHLRYDRLKCSTWKVINAFFIHLDCEFQRILSFTEQTVWFSGSVWYTVNFLEAGKKFQEFQNVIKD